MPSYSLFDDMAQFDEGVHVARRQAVAVAQKRVMDRVGGYLRVSKTREEYDARLDFVAEDVRQIVADVAGEYDVEADKLADAIDEHLKGDGVTDLNGELDDAPSAVGYKAAGGHASDCTCGFCKNKGKLPGSKKDDDDSDDDDSDSDNTSSDSDSKDDSSDDDGDDKPDFLDSKDSALFKEALTAKDFVMLADAVSKAPGDPHALAQHFADYLGTTNPRFDRDRFIAAATGNPASGRDQFQGQIPVTTEPQMPMPGTTAATHEAEAPRDGGGAVVTEKLPKGDGKSIGTEPSPKIDKKKWTDLPKVDDETSGSPHPTVEQDLVDDKPDYEGDFLRDTDAVTESQDLPAADDSGQSTERNVSQDGQSGTWSTDNGVNPVTSSTDPDINPLRAILENGFVPQTQVQSAIESFAADVSCPNCGHSVAVGEVDCPSCGFPQDESNLEESTA